MKPNALIKTTATSVTDKVRFGTISKQDQDTLDTIYATYYAHITKEGIRPIILDTFVLQQATTNTRSPASILTEL